MKVLLTQLRVRSEDAAQNFRAVAKLIERSRLGLSHEDILVLPELIGGESEQKNYEQLTIDLARARGCHVVGGTNHHITHGEGRLSTPALSLIRMGRSSLRTTSFVPTG
jgi:predicted amidohydrolase